MSALGTQHGLFDDELEAPIFIIDKYLTSDYLLICKLLEGEWLCAATAHKILSTRITNHTNNIRKILGVGCIKNIAVSTTSSYYERYIINEDYRQKFIDLKAVYEADKLCMDRVYRRLELERIKGVNV